MNSEASFLFSTFNEFYKCWRSGANSRLFIESVNGKAFINFSAFLGNPDDAHFKPWHSKRNPSKVQRKKSAKKIKRDNDRAARFQESKRKEEEAASAPKSADKPEAIVTSSPGAESAMTISGLEFSFSSPVPENLRHDTSHGTSMILSDKKDQNEQEDDNTFNNSVSEFQGEEDEVQEQCEEDSNLGTLTSSDIIETVNKLGEDLFTAFENEGLVDNRLDIKASLVDRSLIIKSDISATYSGAEDLGATVMRADVFGRCVLWPRPYGSGKAIFLSSESKMRLMSTIDNFKEHIMKLSSIQEKDDFEMTIEK